MYNASESLELIDSSLQFSIQLAFVRRAFSPHATEGYRLLNELVLIYSPNGAYCGQLAGEPAFRSAPHDLILIPGGKPHRMQYLDTGVISAMHVHYQILGGLDLFSLLSVPTLVRGQTALTIAETLEILSEAHERWTVHKSLPSAVRRRELAYRLLGELLEVSTLCEEGAWRLQGIQRLSPVLEYIHNHIGAQITRDHLAAIACLSPSRFSHLFSMLLGMSPKRYILDRRVQQAMRLLRESPLTIGEIAQQLGFYDQFHFSRQFSIMIGISPSTYRSRLQKNPGEKMP
ncbi:MAG TPA: AraC family transcriptional regulator [Armatimonadota bacterium]|jgi:AraC-like DNA-binding protein